ncbi:MAG: hypothetical protein BZY81_06350, partial [SAR202 cluster bacterium Io17-Chloro-G4]
SQTYKSLVQEKADLIAEAQAMFNAAGERDDKAHMRPTTSKNRKSWLLKPGSAMWKFCPIGPLRIKLRKVIAEDGVMKSKKFHKFSIQPGNRNVARAFEATSELLVEMGFGPIRPQDMARIERLCQTVHTPLVKAQWWVNHWANNVAFYDRVPNPPEKESIARATAHAKLAESQRQLETVTNG